MDTTGPSGSVGGRCAEPAGRVETRVGASQCGRSLVVLFRAELRLGPLLGCRSAAAVDVGAELGDVAEDADLVGADLDETAVHRNIELRAVGERDTRVILCQCADERRVAGKEGDLSSAERARDDLGGFTGE